MIRCCSDLMVSYAILTSSFSSSISKSLVGEAVVVVSAWDADDATDGTNARLTYAIEKNVVDEGTGAAIFTMESATGMVRTARCCLDRETTPEYQIQVVASDGGGLKGTGTVVIRVADQNDNSPRLARRLWELQVEETPPTIPPPNTTLLELTAADRDAHNTFLYRVVPDSGHGWENFGVRSVGAAGQLFAVNGLDYELETHRRGFRFMVQVTDQSLEMDNGLVSFPMTRCPLKIGVFCDAVVVDIPDARHAVAGIRDCVIRA
ncbi:putative neural-cadherin 2 [Portunus trituberculatus]|uniref:Putative neural-cadherin 2 n=1 Tax=Portunus trituberculatus TaxID=210409 RepID=A0A5B7DZU0_PORTR|nr:putative neural-cadherin 2 [Portunus trituberculatus]